MTPPRAAPVMDLKSIWLVRVSRAPLDWDECQEMDEKSRWEQGKKESSPLALVWPLLYMYIHAVFSLCHLAESSMLWLTFVLLLQKGRKLGMPIISSPTWTTRDTLNWLAQVRWQLWCKNDSWLSHAMVQQRRVFFFYPCTFAEMLSLLSKDVDQTSLGLAVTPTLIENLFSTFIFPTPQTCSWFWSLHYGNRKSCN